MSRYDDPSWYEDPPNIHNNPTSSRPMGQPAQPMYDDFDRYPFLPPENGFRPPTPPATTPPTPRFNWQRFLGQGLVLIALLVIAFWGGWLCHQFFGQSFDQSNQSKAYSQLVQDAWNKIDQNYVDRKALDYKKMAYAAINAMTQSLGDTGHSRFMDPKTVQSENQQLSGKFTGIGIYLHQDMNTKQLVITAPIPGSPAEKAGLKHGDVIVEINGTNMQGKDTNAASSLIQGSAGTNVTLKIKRSGEEQLRAFTITRAEIQVQNVIMHYIPESHIAHIQVVQFASNVAKDVRDQVNKAKSMGATKIILDLRDNPGGILNEAIDMSSLFLKDGNVLLTQDSSGRRTPIAAKGNPIDTTSPMVILVDNNSASAAEIVSGALKDNKRATIIGQKTFGTGTVLDQFSLSDGSALLLGTQEWLTPNGQFIRQDPNKPGSGGIVPDITVPKEGEQNPVILTPNDENAANMTEQQIIGSGDVQMNAALQYLKEQK